MTIDTARLLETTSSGTLSADQRATAYKALTQSMLDCFRDEDSVAIPGFGTFVAEKVAEHVDTDPATGKRMLYPPCVRLSYQPSVLLRKKITG